MIKSNLSLAVLLALLGLAAADIPWPSSGKLKFAGHPAITDGAWVAAAGSDLQPQITLISNGYGVGQRVNPENTMRTTIYTITSFECLDASTARYIWAANVSTDGGADQPALNCAVARVNATHRVLVNYDKSEGKCPDLASLSAADSGFATSNATGVVRSQVFERVDGVMPNAPVLECNNATTPLPEPTPAVIGDSTLGTKPPADLGTPGGPSTPTGVWSAPGTLEIIAPKGFAAAIISESGEPFSVLGAYLSYRCVDADTYLAGNEQFVMFNNGSRALWYHCEWAQRSDVILKMKYSPGPDCGPLAVTKTAPDLEMTLVRAFPGVDTECGAPVPGPTPAPTPTPPASSAVHTRPAPLLRRSALCSALAIAGAALFL